MDSLFQICFLGLICMTGLCMGSFASVIIHRETTGRPWLRIKDRFSRSSCPSCDSVLQIPDLIPVFSWICLKGKCRKCQSPIPVFYPLLEIATALLAVLIYAWGGLSVFTLTALLCLPFIVSLAYLGAVRKKFSASLVFATAFIGMTSLVVQMMS